MLADWFSGWGQRHRAVFGLNTEADGVMVDAWFDVFQAAGFAADELTDATTWIAANRPPRFRSDHLPAIRDRVRSRREEMYRANEAMSATEGRSPCRWCFGTGRVSVPHLKSVVDGQWVFPWYTLAVTCSCGLGERVRSSLSTQQRYNCGTTLAAYDSWNPNWPKQVDRRNRERVAESRAKRAAQIADGKGPASDAFDTAIQRLKKRFNYKEIGDE